VAVPAGNIVGVEAGHALILNNDILEHLVHRGTHMDIAVCIGRAVVEGIGRLALVLLGKGVVKAVLLPLIQHFRLSLGEVAPHREVGLGKI